MREITCLKATDQDLLLMTQPINQVGESIFSQNTETVAVVSEILPSQGFSLSSLWRGVLGMFALIIIAFLFSANKKAIDWKKVAIGLFLQLIIIDRSFLYV